MSESNKETSPVDDTEEFISQIRKSLLEDESFTPPKDRQIVIHQNVKEIRAILKTNEEIFNRCMPSWNGCYSRLGFNTFTRKECHHVYASNETEEIIDDSDDTDDTDDDEELTEKTVFRVYPEKNEKKFHIEVLCSIPHQLKIILKPFGFGKRKPYTNFIDYDAYFKSSFVLRDELLAPFLFHLKEHLMSVQVCLGEIDAWLMEFVNEGTIKDFFGEVDSLKTKITSTPPVFKMKLCKCPVGRHKPSDKCEICHYQLKRHTSELRTCRFKCPINSMSTYFHCKQDEPHVLKKCPSPGKHQFKFNISKKDERAKLTKFMDFVSS